MKQFLVVLGFFVTFSVAVPAQSPEPPIANTRLTVNTLVREDIFAGFLRNDLVRLARAEKNLELLLASRPVDRPALLAWQGSAALTRAALANEANQPEQFRQHYGRALDFWFLTQMYARFSSRQVGQRRGKTLRMCSCPVRSGAVVCRSIDGRLRGPRSWWGACSAAAGSDASC